MVTYWKKIRWPNTSWEFSQSFFSMFNSNPWHELCSPGIFIVSFNQNLKYKPQKNSRLLFWFAQRDHKVISSYIQSFLWKKICSKLGISLMNEQWTWPCKYSANIQKSVQSEETGTLYIHTNPWIHCFGNTHVSVFLWVKLSFQLHAHFWASDEHQ